MPGEKTEPATAKRRRDERKKGNILMCKDITTVASLFASTCALWLTGSSIVSNLKGFFFFCTTLISEGGINIVERNGNLIVSTLVSTFLAVVTVPIAVTLVVSIGVTLYQTKGLVSTESIKPSFSKLNPISGFKNLFSLKSAVEALKNIVKISILFYIIINYYVENVLKYRIFFSLSPDQSAVIVLEDIFTLMLRIGLAFTVIAGLDFFYQKWEYERKMKMSKEDIKEEYKQTEGDPKVKAKIKQKQMSMAMSRMMNSVPAADVIVKNPTHYAVALRYKRGQDAAPVILAMGEDQLAFRIIKVGERHQIPIVEDVPLARALYAQGTINAMIPEELYNAVAKIMINLYNLGGNTQANTSKKVPPKTEQTIRLPQSSADRREIPVVTEEDNSSKTDEL